jgi:hypothetical protein
MTGRPFRLRAERSSTVPRAEGPRVAHGPACLRGQTIRTGSAAGSAV